MQIYNKIFENKYVLILIFFIMNDFFVSSLTFETFINLLFI